MIANRILIVILGIICIAVIPVQLITTTVLALVVAITFGLVLLPLSLVWMLFLAPLLALSWVCNKAPALRDVLGIVFMPWALVANIFVAPVPSMGEFESRALKLMYCGSWPYTWELWQYSRGKTDLESADPAIAGLNEVLQRLCSRDPIMQRVLSRIASGQELDPGM